MQTLFTEEIGKSYRGRRVVNGVSLAVNQGEVVGLLGPNGAGKTTSFYMIVGLIPPDTGRVMIGDVDITDVPMYLRARNYGISYLPQEASVFRKLSVEENILAVLETQSSNWQERRDKMEGAARPAWPGPYPQEQRLCAERRRTPPGGNRPRPVHQSQLHPAG